MDLDYAHDAFDQAVSDGLAAARAVAPEPLGGLGEGISLRKLVDADFYRRDAKRIAARASSAAVNREPQRRPRYARGAKCRKCGSTRRFKLSGKCVGCVRRLPWRQANRRGMKA